VVGIPAVGLDRKVSKLETDVTETKAGVQLLVGTFTGGKGSIG
jgi:hypothetical protein